MAFRANGVRLSKRKSKHKGFRSRMKAASGGKVPNLLKRKRLKGRKVLTPTLKRWI
jgi:ribosomal protein L34